MIKPSASSLEKKIETGFTLVELLIVIVVIAILAAITIISYGAVQRNATNAKTTSALETWIKGLQMYKVDNGHWPSGLVCLGDGYLYGPTGTDPSGTAQCRQDPSVGVLESDTFNAAMKSYFGGNFPTPSFVTAYTSDTLWRRGLSYYYGGGDGTQVYIIATYAGTSGSCPSVAGVTGTYGAYPNGNSTCIYLIGHISDT